MIATKVATTTAEIEVHRKRIEEEKETLTIGFYECKKERALLVALSESVDMSADDEEAFNTALMELDLEKLRLEIHQLELRLLELDVDHMEALNKMLATYA